MTIHKLIIVSEIMYPGSPAKAVEATGAAFHSDAEAETELYQVLLYVLVLVLLLLLCYCH